MAQQLAKQRSQPHGPAASEKDQENQVFKMHLVKFLSICSAILMKFDDFAKLRVPKEKKRRGETPRTPPSSVVEDDNQRVIQRTTWPRLGDPGLSPQSDFFS